MTLREFLKKGFILDYVTIVYGKNLVEHKRNQEVLKSYNKIGLDYKYLDYEVDDYCAYVINDEIAFRITLKEPLNNEVRNCIYNELKAVLKAYNEGKKGYRALYNVLDLIERNWSKL